MLDKDELQIEKGNFTRITNPLIENLIQIPFKGCELAVILFIIRKTYGYQKIEDEISLSQFCLGLSRSKQTIVTSLKNIQLVNIVRLVKRGNSKKQSNIWRINKYYNTWKLVNIPRLVKRKGSTSLTNPPQLVYVPRHTKENKRKTKEMIDKDFETFYTSYPRKVGKKKAMAIFLKLDKELLPVILQALEKVKQSDQWKDPQFIPHPTTWLNQARWEDEETELTPEQDAIDLIKKHGKNNAQFKFQGKYGDEVLTKYYNLFQ